MEELDRSYEVIDNFVQPKVFDIMQKKIMNNYFPWFHYDTIVREGEDKKDLTFYSMHMLYDNDRPTFPNSFEIMDPVLGELMKLDDPKFRMNTLIRVKINNYPNQGKFREHTMHTDWPSKGGLNRKACLFGINTCDGYTKLDNGKESVKIDSKANRAILFDPTIPHCSTNTTNDTRRVNINFNYF